MHLSRSMLAFVVSSFAAASVYLLVDESGQLHIGLAILVFIALLWLTEAFHVTITALLVPLLAVLSGVFDVKQALIQFAHPVIILFLGGFALASAMHQQRLDQQLAGLVLRMARGRSGRAALLVFVFTAMISMWISNTATTAMMLPLALGLLTRVDYKQNPHSYWFLLLGIAYSANIGGIGTLVGSPPNAIAAANTGISFAEWLRYGIPAVLLMLPLMLGILYWLFRPRLEFHFTPDEHAAILNRKQWLTLVVFACTVSAWLMGKPLAAWLEVKDDFDSLVSLAAIFALAGLRLVSWKQIQSQTDWGVLILFGGGLTLSSLLQATGSSAFLGEQVLSGLDQAPTWLFVLVLCGFVVMLTEVASNTASSALLIPIFISVAGHFALDDQSVAVMIAMAASCAFMLPVATPPNAIVFGSGLVPQRQMMRCGIVLNLAMTLLITSLVLMSI